MALHRLTDAPIANPVMLGEIDLLTKHDAQVRLNGEEVPCPFRGLHRKELDEKVEIALAGPEFARRGGTEERHRLHPVSPAEDAEVIQTFANEGKHGW